MGGDGVVPGQSRLSVVSSESQSKPLFRAELLRCTRTRDQFVGDQLVAGSRNELFLGSGKPDRNC